MDDITIIKNILEKNNMSLLFDYDDLATECYHKPLGRRGDNANDTRCMLNKNRIDLMKFLMGINAKLDYIGSGATGHTFRGDIYRDDEVVYKFALKTSAYPKKETYGNITNMARPENAEIAMLRTLSYFIINQYTPHLVLPIITFYADIKFFILLAKYDHIKHNIAKYNEFIKKYNDGKYDDNVSILISEWANRGDFLDYIRKKYKNFQQIHWRVFFFQILSVLAVIQSKYPNFRHNDMKANNILIHKLDRKTCENITSWSYKICGKNYVIPNIGYHIKLWDFDFSCIKGVVDNAKVNETWTKEINITSKKNRYYDIHYFFNTLIRFVPELLNDREHVPSEVVDFIMRIVPQKYRAGQYVAKKGRILVDDEYTTPQRILENDEFMGVFRKS